jgi:hypothetical protein
MTPENLAAIAGAAWLDSGLTRDPNENELADVGTRLQAPEDSLGLVRACVPIAESVGYVLACRRRATR